LLDTTELLEQMRDLGSLPTSDTRLTSAKLLAAATLEMREGLCPLLWDAEAEWGVYEASQAVVSGTEKYRLPSRSAGGRLRDVVFVDASGTEDSLEEISPDDERARNAGTGTPRFYFLRNFHVVLVPTPNASGTLKTPYYARPAKLVATSSAATVADGATGFFTLTSGANLSDEDGMLTVDFVRATPGFETLSSDVSATLADSGTTLTLPNADASSEVVAGDYVCNAGEAPVVQLPPELFGLLAIRAARRALLGVGDAEAAKALESSIAELEEKARHWLSPRVDGESQQVGDAWSGLLFGLGGG
jgi:hypothetical protein